MVATAAQAVGEAMQVTAAPASVGAKASFRNASVSAGTR